VLATGHQALVNDFGSIVPAGVDVNALLDNRVRPCAKHFANLVAAGLDHRLLWLGSRLLGVHDELVMQFLLRGIT